MHTREENAVRILSDSWNCVQSLFTLGFPSATGGTKFFRSNREYYGKVPPAVMALLETMHRANSQLNASFRQPQEAQGTLSVFFKKISDNINSGTSTVSTGAAKAADQVALGATAIGTGAGKVTDSLANAASDVASFFRNLSGDKRKSSATLQSVNTAHLTDSDPFLPSRDSAGSLMTPSEQSITTKRIEGIYGVDYSKYPISAYVQLPTALQPFIKLPGLDHYLVVGRPTMDKSGGLSGYRECVPKSVRAAAPFLIIVDEAGKVEGFTDKSYLWYEFKLVDVFKLDVSKMKSFDDYLNKLSRKARWNCKDRQKKLAKSPLVVEYIPLPRDREFLNKLLPLYQQTGEKNGFCVLDEKAFYEFHLNTPDLTVMLIKDTSQEDRLVTFCTGVRAGDTIMPMWCGTDYDHELAMKCSSYYNMLYEYFKVAIADPTINWVDLGATRRQAKTGIGCDAYPVSGYVRCKNSIMVAIVETMMKEYFKPEELMNDP